MKRYLVYPFDFDGRAAALEIDTSGWDEERRQQWRDNNAGLIERLRHEFGAEHFDRKLADFTALGPKPFSIDAHHNQLHQQARQAFVQGLYYPALTAACALGERMLNHLMLDLRDHFKQTPEYKDVFKKKSFDDWRWVCDVLESWGVFQTDAVKCAFLKLMRLRHRSLHFNPETYATLREDALAALGHLSVIIADQFGFARTQRWLLPGTAGQFFIKKEAEQDPFVRTYYLPQCPKVGPLFSINFIPGGIVFFDRDYPTDEITDEEFARRYETRNPAEVAPSDLSKATAQVVQVRMHGEPVKLAKAGPIDADAVAGRDGDPAA